MAFNRAQLVDALGTVVRDSDVNITYAVVSGPIRIVGVGSGAIANHQPPQGAAYATWQGLGRLVVQATLDCTGPHRAMAQGIDLDAGPGAYAADCPAEGHAVISAAAPGGLSATVRLPVSGRWEDSPSEVARANTVLEYDYFERVQP